MNEQWTRRRFVGSAAAAGMVGRWPMLWAQEHLPVSQASSPEITAGKLTPLLESNVSRPLRYTPVGGGYQIKNGKQCFNRPLYGPNIPFRVDGGDLPEFSLYLPGHGGNLRLGVKVGDGPAKWLQECDSVHMQYIDGHLEYEIHDASIDGGTIHIEALTHGASFWLKASAAGVPQGAALVWAFGGASGRKGKRNGDIGCEDEPVTEFFHLRPKECAGNEWTLRESAAEVKTTRMRIRVSSSVEPEMRLSDASRWDDGWSSMWENAAKSPALPVMLARAPLGSGSILLSIEVLEGTKLPGDAVAVAASESAFAQRRRQLAGIAETVAWRTPDAYLDGTAAALGIAADAIWDEQQGCVMHGAVAWRMPLAGWRGPYCLDVLGRHDRMQRHLRHWIAKQNLSAVTNGSGGKPSADGFAGIANAKGQPDPGSHEARTENLLHSDGDLSHNHYDMNLVFFDALLRHLNWTGDLAFAREAWPALERHAAWERRLFRREYGTAVASSPLYEAYAAIWASDNLQYNGGGAAHSSAYNVYLNRAMADLADMLGEPKDVSASYRAEADAIARAMREQLWMPEVGAFAESREWLGERRLAEDPAVWTMYQALDSEVPDEVDAWQAAADQLRRLRKVPVRGQGVPEAAGWQLACSDWMPYVWSLTLLVTAENLATALAFYQAGMAEEGYALMRGTLVDAGFRGLCPGNFPMSLQLDPHRQESQRDFGDPIGCASRLVVEGLWGVRPNLLQGELGLRPQLPLEWKTAELVHPELQVVYRREGQHETWRVAQKFGREVKVALELRGRGAGVPRVVVDGKAAESRFVSQAVGEPRLEVQLPAGHDWVVEVEWRGARPVRRSGEALWVGAGERVVWPAGVQSETVRDPQRVLRDGQALRAGTVFLLQRHESCEYWLPVELALKAPAVRVKASSVGTFEPVEMDSLLSGRVSEILSREYVAPRPGLCSLNLPIGLLGGWADFDAKAVIDDAGLRGAGGHVALPGGLRFLTPAGGRSGNCCYVSQWVLDRPRVSLPLAGRARRLHLLLAGTTFPQATRSTHAELTVAYQDGAVKRVVLTSPDSWWPVEQDYLVDDYVFRMGEPEDTSVSVPWRVDLLTGKSRATESLRKPGTLGGKVRGGSGFVLSVELDAARKLKSLEVHVPLYGVVLGWMGTTLERA